MWEEKHYPLPSGEFSNSQGWQMEEPCFPMGTGKPLRHLRALWQSLPYTKEEGDDWLGNLFLCTIEVETRSLMHLGQVTTSYTPIQARPCRTQNSFSPSAGLSGGCTGDSTSFCDNFWRTYSGVGCALCRYLLHHSLWERSTLQLFSAYPQWLYTMLSPIWSPNTHAMGRSAHGLHTNSRGLPRVLLSECDIQNTNVDSVLVDFFCYL